MVLMDTCNLQRAHLSLALWDVEKKQKQKNNTETLLKPLFFIANIIHESKCFIWQMVHMTLLKS